MADDGTDRVSGRGERFLDRILVAWVDGVRDHSGVALVLTAVALGTLGFGGFVASDLRTRMVSINFRLFTWQGTWEMIMTQPWLGTGVGSFPPIYPAFRRPPIFHIEGKQLISCTTMSSINFVIF